MLNHHPDTATPTKTGVRQPLPVSSQLDCQISARREATFPLGPPRNTTTPEHMKFGERLPRSTVRQASRRPVPAKSTLVPLNTRIARTMLGPSGSPHRFVTAAIRIATWHRNIGVSEGSVYVRKSRKAALHRARARPAGLIHPLAMRLIPAEQAKDLSIQSLDLRRMRV